MQLSECDHRKQITENDVESFIEFQISPLVFVVGNLALRQGFLGVLRNSSFSIIPPVLHSHLFMYHLRSIILKTAHVVKEYTEKMVVLVEHTCNIEAPYRRHKYTKFYSQSYVQRPLGICKCSEKDNVKYWKQIFRFIIKKWVCTSQTKALVSQTKVSQCSLQKKSLFILRITRK